MESRPIRIDSFEVVSYEDGILIADIRVSKGTYIRSIACDLGLAVSSRAHLVALVRTSIGPFALSEATEVDEHVDLTNDYLGRLEQMALATVSDDQLFPLQTVAIPITMTSIKMEATTSPFTAGMECCERWATRRSGASSLRCTGEGQCEDSYVYGSQSNEDSQRRSDGRIGWRL